MGDRSNSRIQIFTQEGEFIEEWTQFGRPSGLFITDDTTVDPEVDLTGTSFAEWAAMDAERNVYTGEIGPQDMRKWIPLFPIMGRDAPGDEGAAGVE